MSRKTTIYLPDDLKAGVTEEANRRGISEAEVIRQAVAASLARPRPRAGFLDCQPIAENAEQFLEGFGER